MTAAFGQDELGLGLWSQRDVLGTESHENFLWCHLQNANQDRRILTAELGESS